MGPRKRAKLQPGTGDDVSTKSADTPRMTPSTDDVTEGGGSGRLNKSVSTSKTNEATPVSSRPTSIKDAGYQVRAVPRWYGDSWPRISKASAVTQVARESILASPVREKPANISLPLAGQSNKNLSEVEPSPKNPSTPLSRPAATSRRSTPLDAQTTKVNVTSSGASEPGKTNGNGSANEPARGEPEVTREQAANEEQLAAGQKEQSEKAPPPPEDKDKLPPASSAGWLEWLPRPGLGSRVTPAVPGNENTPSEAKTDEAKKDEGGGKPGPEATPSEAKTGEAKNNEGKPGPEANSAGSRGTTGEQAVDQQAPIPTTDGLTETQQYGRSWFGYWSAGSESKTTVALGEENAGDTKPKAQEPKLEEVADSKKPDDDKDMTKGESSDAAPVPLTTSTWAFWSKMSSGPSKDSDTPATATASQETGEAPKPQSKSEPIKTDSKPAPKNASKPVKEPSTTRKAVAQSQQEPSRQSIFEPSTSTTTNDAAKGTSKQDTQKNVPPNLLLPSFRDTYQVTTTEPFLQYLARLLLRGKQAPPKHVSLEPHPQRIKRALAIGIHGFFPAQFVRTFIGRPTGTSFKFASASADAIRDFTKSRGYECEVEAIALEGEGKIAERVDVLWKMLLKWIDKIQKADFILVACHSQGVPVATMLVAKLIEFECVSSARVGICGMAGINLGPFPDYKSRLFSGSASELFEFSDTQSAVSKRYEDALRVAVKHGVRIVYIGSLDDQLVPMESSIFANINHPYIYRAVFVDGRVHAPDFITHLVGFALKLRNLGISDHGLIRELSAPLAGSLYTGEGHSRLYDDQNVYNLAVEHALETTSVPAEIPLQIQSYEPRNPSNNNPFVLPWAMRGLLEEEYVRTALRDETAELLALFDNWRPTTKVLKDVKFRLEAVKSKL
ncbi:MAG: hypothetical protein M1823_000346 [Watsoniomyces obsoletus]|nr:MAG: hypothetical protein M1823_000346 [Watsoniomyces obsoletus]